MRTRNCYKNVLFAAAFGAALVTAAAMPTAVWAQTADATLRGKAAANTEVVRAQLKSMATLGSTDAIDDILITLSTQFDIVRPLAANPSIFLYLAMDKNKSNMALARFKVTECEKQLVL